MSANPEKVHLTDTIYNLLLLQVTPGREELVVSSLSKLSQNLTFYLGLGRYDLVVLRQSPSVSLFEEYDALQLSGITDCFPVCGVEWKTASTIEPVPFRKSPFLGVCMLKLDPRASVWRSIGPLAEEMSLVSKILTSLDIKVCCNLSNYELVFLIEVKKISELAHILGKIKESLVENGKSIVLDITTIPCIKVEYLDGKLIYNESDLQEQASVDVFLSLNVGLNDRLLKIVNSSFPSCAVKKESIYGFHDVILSVDGPLDKIVKGIMSLRREHNECGLHSTFTMLAHNGNTLSSCVLEQQSYEPETISLIQDDLSEDVYHFNQLINTCKQDFLTTNLFRSHKEMLDSALSLIADLQRKRESKDMLKYRELLERYDSLTDILRQSFSQRFAGLAPGNLLAHKSLGLEPHGSIQRAILALESIPLFVSKKLSHKWSGLCTYGYSHRFYNTAAGVFNVPDQYRASPNMWWGIFHEIGHEMVRYLPTDVRSKVMTIIDEMAAKAFSAEKRSNKEERLRTHKAGYVLFAGEIFAELFGFYHGFHGDWELYKQKVWRYFAKEFPIDGEYLARSVLVFLSLGPGKTKRKNEITYDYLTQRFDELEHVAAQEFKVYVDVDQKQRARVILSQFLDISDIYGAWIEDRPKLSNYNKLETAKMLESLSEGSPVFCDDPLQIMFALMDFNEERIPTKMRIASILSLYEKYWNILNQDS